MSQLKCLIALIAVGLLFSGCRSMIPVQMCNKSWNISKSFVQVVDNDSSYLLTFGDGHIEKGMSIIGKTDYLLCNPQMYKYVQEILSLSKLPNARVLFFVPRMDEMFVELPKNYIETKPNSISVNMLDENPYAVWIREDELEKWSGKNEEKWFRRDEEMYTNIYIDKKHKLLVIVDRFNYGDVPIARIQRIQTLTNRINNKFPNNEICTVWADVTKVEHLEALSNWIDGHRNKAIVNYKIGQEQKLKRK